MKTNAPGSFRFALTAGACLLLLPLKLFRGWNAAPLIMLLSSWVAEACFLFLLCALGIWLAGSRPVRRVLVGGLVLLGLELPAFAGIVAHTAFLPDAVGRRWALLDATPAWVRYFLVEVVPRWELWTAGAALLVLCVAAFVIARRVSPPPPKPALLVLGVLTIAVFVHQARSEFYPSVLWEVGVDLAEIVSHPAVTGPRDAAELADAGTGRPAAWPEQIPFDRVIVFVMESVPVRSLEEQMGDLPKDSFFNRERAHTHAYTNYYTTNQDSRTGMMSMLFSRLVPFEAYSEDDVQQYSFMREERSLVDEMAARGFATAVAASQIDEEVVVHELPSWNDKLMISQAEYDHPGGFLCLNPYQFEQGCEDKILLPKIFKELDSHKRLFLFQEAVYGHDEEYETQIKKTPVEYYGEHLQAIQNHLAWRGELDRTLIVVTSDHGIRSVEGWTRRWVYRLPLLLINPRFTREDRPGMYCQSDFVALLAAEMAGLAPPAPRTTALFVGPTNTSILGSVTADGDLLVLRNRRLFHYVLADGNCPDDNVPASKPRHPVSPAALVARFKSLRDSFRPGMRPAVPAANETGRH